MSDLRDLGFRGPRSAASSDLAAVIELILEQQANADRNVPSLGVDSAGVAAELEALEPPWFETLRIVCREDGTVTGAVLVDWSIEARRAWINGPWIRADDEVWPVIGAALATAATAQLPSVIERSTLSAGVEHRCMAQLAVRLGWSATEVNHVLVTDAETINAWPKPKDGERLRSMTLNDVTALGPLHAVEFPATYYSAAELAARVARGDQIVLIAERDGGGIDGYVAGQIQPDGDGYIDFLAVAPSARRSGVGKRLLVMLCRQLVARSTSQRVCLTVQDGRAPARRLYESLGFGYDISIVGFESPAPPADR